MAAFTLVLAACSSSSSAGDDASGDDSSGSSLTIALDGATELSLGEPLELTLTLTNQGAKSVAAPVDVSLVSPDGTHLPFYRTSLFVPFGESASEAITVTTSRWYAETGNFDVVAEVTDTAIGANPGVAPVHGDPTERSAPRFEDVTAQAGLVTDVPVPKCGQFSNGAAWADVDGDGWQDLLVTRLGDPVQLFVNRGDGTFADESAERGVVATGANGAAFADYDNDGDPDLALVGDGPTGCCRTTARGTSSMSRRPQVVAGDAASRGMSATWGDYDSDGLLDLYVTNYMECTGPWTTASDVISNVAYHLDVLYHNEGDGTFRVVTSDLPDSDTDAAGFTPPGWTSTATTGSTCSSPTISWGCRRITTGCGTTTAAVRPGTGCSATSRSSRAPVST